MLMLLNWRVWFAVGLALSFALIGAGGYSVGKKHVQAQWDAEKVVQLAAAAHAEVENRRIETKRQTGVIDAQNAQTKRTAVLQADAATSRAAVDSLRDTIRTTTASLPSRTPSAVSSYATDAAQLLGECGAAYTGLAGQADAIWSERQTLIDGWPK